MDILKIFQNIEGANIESINKAKAYQLSLAKPPRSLGLLEDISIKLAGITGKLFNDVNRRCLLVFSADNGVVEEGVSSTPMSVTLAQSINLTKGLTGASVLAKTYHTDLFVYDVGINAETGEINDPHFINKKIAMGTKNISHGPAMSYDEAIEAITIGYEAVKSRINDYDIFGIGEMGIGNTTTSSAVLATLLNVDVEIVTGKGAGLSDEKYLHKIDIINKAIKVNKPNSCDVIDVLSKVGGFDLAAMTGAYLACAYYKKPVVVDGFISIVASLCAYRINNKVKDYLFLSHESFEIGYKLAKDELGLEPMFNLKMRLGEGSGCPIAFEIIHGACSIMNNMATFSKARINDDYIEEIIGEENFTIKDK